MNGADESRDFSWITSILPHRYPMLLVDRVLEIEPKQRIVAIKNVTANEEFFNGHFPGNPVMPGVLLVEGMAQAAGILVLHDDPRRAEKLLFFMSIDRARFRRPVVPRSNSLRSRNVAHATPPLQAQWASSCRWPGRR